MQTIILEILDELNRRGSLNDEELAQIIRRHNKVLYANTAGANVKRKDFSKKHLLPWYLKIKEQEPNRWASWNVSDSLEKLLIATLQVKPRRTASGVATITVLTKPWPCANDCLYCPNDLRMPKSYLHDEPACQRAERNYFDPYLQVMSRLRALVQMGHACDKIELIVLGGSWTDYPQEYQIWFVSELFRALNEYSDAKLSADCAKERRLFYHENGLSCRDDEILCQTEDLQSQVDASMLSYKQAYMQLYGLDSVWAKLAGKQIAEYDALQALQLANEDAAHRVVGLSIETRPDALNCENLFFLRKLGCTKIQIGVQSLDAAILAMNNRGRSQNLPASDSCDNQQSLHATDSCDNQQNLPASDSCDKPNGAGATHEIKAIANAFILLRLFGFKIQAHFMLNLFGATTTTDKRDYWRFVNEQSWLPDEVKLYPCSLVNGTALQAKYSSGEWQPYTQAELLDVLSANMLATPPFVRVSRMIRDISAKDILVGNKKTNLRQMVDARLADQGDSSCEIRSREICQTQIELNELSLDDFSYETIVTYEHFLQWVTKDNRIAGFLRLSLPKPEYLSLLASSGHVMPIGPSEAMIRELHVYGKVAQLTNASLDEPTVADETNNKNVENNLAACELKAKHTSKLAANAQHLGLGRQLIAKASAIAKEHGYNKLNVISSVGTRHYYRNLGFVDNGLYQQKYVGQ
ncbi:MAG: GNAT family N-acetyltransferase [Coriobacteriales bacterium]|jgi:elongator complex protein 3|nr:GNAT family N-acetyltransferase [Coriobacteriales bacterium]